MNIQPVNLDAGLSRGRGICRASFSSPTDPSAVSGSGRASAKPREVPGTRWWWWCWVVVEGLGRCRVCNLSASFDAERYVGSSDRSREDEIDIDSLAQLASPLFQSPWYLGPSRPETCLRCTCAVTREVLGPLQAIGSTKGITSCGSLKAMKFER